jgi:hypothetical protein
MSRAAADLMSPAAAALIRPAGVVPVLASHPAAGPPDPAVASDLRGVAQEGAQAVLEVRVASAVGQVAAVSVEAGAANGDLRNCVAALGAAGATYPSFHLSDPDDVADPDVNFRQVANDFFPSEQMQLMKFNGAAWEVFGDIITDEVGQPEDQAPQRGALLDPHYPGISGSTSDASWASDCCQPR